MLLLSQLAPYLRAQVEQARAELPSTLAWPTTGYASFTDCSDSLLRAFAGVLAIDGVSHTVIADNPNRLDPSAVDVTWSLEINEGTGMVRAVPTFSGIRVEGGLPNQLDLLCRAVGFHARVICRFEDRLVRLANVTLEGDVEFFQGIGIDPAIVDYYVEAGKLAGIRFRLRCTLQLP